MHYTLFCDNATWKIILLSDSKLFFSKPRDHLRGNESSRIPWRQNLLKADTDWGGKRISKSADLSPNCIYVVSGTLSDVVAGEGVEKVNFDRTEIHVTPEKYASKLGFKSMVLYCTYFSS